MPKKPTIYNIAMGALRDIAGATPELLNHFDAGEPEICGKYKMGIIARRALRNIDKINTKREREICNS